MSKKGCLNGCIHHKKIKLPEMKEQYSFRCNALGAYMKESDTRKNCRFYIPPYKVHTFSIEDFLND